MAVSTSNRPVEPGRGAPGGLAAARAAGADAPPVVSICMPHLNSGAYLRDRLGSILAQTLGDWELIVVDSQSDDGSLEELTGMAAGDPRIRILQAPRDGIYTNLNRAIERARGRYIYIATSDDTMEPDCLERMVAAVEARPECAVAHCCLRIIDENGAVVDGPDGWENFDAPRYFGSWMSRSHVRRAPHDGLLHYQYYTVFTSLTQLLVRRDVFGRVGLFPTDCGSHADFAWGMRVGLVENIVHVPLPLATWRRHGSQATTGGRVLRARLDGEFHRLAREATDWVGRRQPRLRREIRRRGLHLRYLVDELDARLARPSRRGERLARVAVFLAKHPWFCACRSLRRLSPAAWRRPRAPRSMAADVRELTPDGGPAET